MEGCWTARICLLNMSFVNSSIFVTSRHCSCSEFHLRFWLRESCVCEAVRVGFLDRWALCNLSVTSGPETGQNSTKACPFLYPCDRWHTVYSCTYKVLLPLLKKRFLNRHPRYSSFFFTCHPLNYCFIKHKESAVIMTLWAPWIQSINKTLKYHYSIHRIMCMLLYQTHTVYI